MSMYTFYNHFLNYAFVILFIIIFKEKKEGLSLLFKIMKEMDKANNC